MSEAAAKLDLHAARRSRSVPTVSVLAGPPGLAIRAFRDWARRRGFPDCRTDATDPLGVAADWLTGVIAVEDLAGIALAELARRTGRPRYSHPAEWTSLSSADLDERWRSLPVLDLTSPLMQLCRLVVRDLVSGQGQDAVRLTRELAERSDCLNAVAALVGLLPETRRPTLNLTPRRDRLGPAIELAGRLAAAAPGIHVAVVVGQGILAEYVSACPDSRACVLAREGLIEFESLGESALRGRLGGEVPDSAVCRLAEAGADEEFAEQARRTAEILRDDPAGDQARSEAERFLFGLLDGYPPTAGLFELNAKLGFDFGGREAEADFLARDAGVVIELDGHYHFQDQVAYRRDRTKDWLYQRNGYLVLRFMAEDVVERMEEILDRVCEALAHRGEQQDTED